MSIVVRVLCIVLMAATVWYCCSTVARSQPNPAGIWDVPPSTSPNFDCHWEGSGSARHWVCRPLATYTYDCVTLDRGYRRCRERMISP